MKRPAWLDKLICRVIGHATDPCDVYCCVCFRCGYEWWHYENPPRSDLGFWLTYYNFRDTMTRRSFRNWLKCPDCGKRFDHHRHDCMPF